MALGEPHERITAEPAAATTSKKAKKDSCWGIGRHAPHEDGARVVDGVKVPMGKGGPNAYLAQHDARLRKAEKGAVPALQYNECAPPAPRRRPGRRAPPRTASAPRAGSSSTRLRK